MYNDKRRNLEGRRKEAREHPIRAQILNLYTQDKNLSLAGVDLLSCLTSHDELTIAQVGYHVSVLREVELLPERAHPPARPPGATGRST